MFYGVISFANPPPLFFSPHDLPTHIQPLTLPFTARQLMFNHALFLPRQSFYVSKNGRYGRLAGAGLLLLLIPYLYRGFYAYCDMFALRSSNPSLVYKARRPDGAVVVIDDYLDSYE
eukprot:365392-Chlamydomonas_euryale.AAC.2